jgi:hypothetical protein
VKRLILSLLAFCALAGAQGLSVNIPLVGTPGASLDLSAATYLKIPTVTSDPAGSCPNAAAIVLNVSTGAQAGHMSACIGGAWQLIGSGAGGTGPLPETVYNNQANTYGAFLQDFGLGTITLPKAAGAAPTASGQVSYDLTSNSYKGGFNGSTNTFAYVSGSPTVGNCVQIGSNGLLTAAGGPCAAGGGVVSLNGILAASQSFVDDTNVTMVHAGSSHTITWAGRLAKSRTLGSTVYADQTNAFSAFLQDFSLATLKVPIGAGLAPVTSGLFGYDSTANLLVAGINGLAGKIPYFLGSPSGCVSISAGVLSGSGVACGAGGGGSPAFSAVTAGTNTTALHMGSGGSLDTTSGGTITATSLNGTGTMELYGATGSPLHTPVGGELDCVADPAGIINCRNSSLAHSVTVKTNTCPPGLFTTGVDATGAITCGVPGGNTLAYTTPLVITQSGTTNTQVASQAMVTPGGDHLYSFGYYVTQTSLGTGCTAAGNISFELSYSEGATGTALVVDNLGLHATGAGNGAYSSSLALSTSSAARASGYLGYFFAGSGSAVTLLAHSTAAAGSGCSVQPQVTVYPVLAQVY